MKLSCSEAPDPLISNATVCHDWEVLSVACVGFHLYDTWNGKGKVMWILKYENLERKLRLPLSLSSSRYGCLEANLKAISS